MPERNELLAALRRRPDALARIAGSASYPCLSGTARFYQTGRGVLVAAEVRGLPEAAGHCENNIFAFHIHAGGTCAGNAADPFADALGHYNPESCPHPAHAGDLPPLFSDRRGSAFQIVLTDRFTVREIVGKTVIIHSRRDDFTTQPAGDPGVKIACGQIKAFSRR